MHHAIGTALGQRGPDVPRQSGNIHCKGLGNRRVCRVMIVHRPHACDIERNAASGLAQDDRPGFFGGVAHAKLVHHIGICEGDIDNGKTAEELLEEDIPWIERFKQVFWTYLPLGFVAFGGPQAHVAILRDHLVVQRNWLDEEQFTELFAIGQG